VGSPCRCPKENTIQDSDRSPPGAHRPWRAAGHRPDVNFFLLVFSTFFPPGRSPISFVGSSSSSRPRKRRRRTNERRKERKYKKINLHEILKQRNARHRKLKQQKNENNNHQNTRTNDIFDSPWRVCRVLVLFVVFTFLLLSFRYLAVPRGFFLFITFLFWFSSLAFEGQGTRKGL